MRKPLFIAGLIIAAHVTFAQNTNPWPATGNVGIGTTSPNRSLTVNGIIIAWGSSDNPGQGTLSLGDEGGHYWGFRRTLTGSHLSIDAWNGAANVEHLRILSNNGFVGMGTATPGGRLSVVGADANSVEAHILNSNASGYSALRLGVDAVAAAGTVVHDFNGNWAGTGAYTANTSNFGSFKSNGLNLTADNASGAIRMFTGGNAPGNQRLIIDAAGNIGINTTTPAQKLDVDGTIKATGFLLTTGAAAGKVLTSDASGNASWQIAAGAGWGFNGSTVGAMKSIGTVDNYDLPFITNNTERMRVLAGGSVAIGTASLPSADAKLAVKGSIYSTKVKVTQNGWADHVFYPDYRLRPLSEVEQYIRQHLHLPEVPSAKEVQQEGLDLGDNQAVLLQKIEELTLYIIEQDKQIKKISELNEKLLQQQRAIEALQKAVYEKQDSPRKVDRK